MNFRDSGNGKSIGERLSFARGVSFNRVAKCVDTCRRSDAGRRSHCEGRVDDCQRGNNRRTAEQHFDVVFRVGNNCVLRDFGADARRRHEAYSLGGVHRRAAAERNDEVAFLVFVDLQACLNDFVGRLGVRSVVDDVRNFLWQKIGML